MANLYDKAGLVNIPVGYQDGFLYNIKPTDNTLGFRFNRDSAATRVNEKGLIEQVGYFGPELVTNGDFATDSDWVKQSGWSISDGIATLDGTQVGSSGLGSSTMSVTSGKIYKVVVNVISTSSGFRLYDNNGVIAYGLSLGKNVFYRTVTSSTYQVTPLGLSGTTGSIDNVSVQEILGDKPRIDYTDSLTSPSFLLEPQSTNLITYSEDFSNSSWAKTNCTINSNNAISPDGTQNADKLDFTTSNGEIVRTTTGFVVGQEYTMSFYAKTESGTLDFTYGNMDYVSVSGTATTEWQRFELTQTLPSATRFPKIQTTEIGSLLLWGFQVEQGSYATSYIPTYGSTATRAQETCTGAGSASTFNSTEGVLYAEIAALADDGANRSITISDGSTNNIVQILFSSVSNTIRCIIRVGGVGGDNLDKSTTSYTVTDFNKVALKWEQNNAQVWINGTQLGSPDTNSDVPIGLNDLSFEYLSIGNKFYGKCKALAVFKEALTDDELQQLTGPEYNSFAALAAAYNYTVI